MTSGRVALVWLVLFASGGYPCAATTFVGEREKWRHVQSPHFELYTMGGEREGRDTLYRLEVIRSVFFDGFKLRERLPLQLTVFRFDTEKVFKAYLPPERGTSNTAGLYVNRPDRATVLLGPMGDADFATHVINHEFVHHLFGVTEEEPPTWYNEGMADLLGALKIEQDRVVLGRPVESNVMTLRKEPLLPLERLFAVNRASPIYTDGKHTGLFYAQSWGLLHFLYFGESQLPEKQVEQYLQIVRNPRAYENPDTMRTLTQDLLGLTYPELLRRLQRYVQTGRYSGRSTPVPDLPKPATYVTRPASAEEMHLRLAELALRVQRAPLGKLALLNAAERETVPPRVYEVLGSAALEEGDELTARETWERAMAAGSTNPAVYHRLAQIEGQRWFRSFDYYFRMRPEQADRFRLLLNRSIQSAPNQSTAYELLAWVEGTAQQPDLGNVNLVQSKFPTLKNRARALLGLVLVRHHVGDDATALKLLDDLARLDPDDRTEHAAAEVRARIEKRPLPAAPPRPAPQAPVLRPPAIHVPE